MIHRRTYDVIELEKPNKDYKYTLSETKDGVTKPYNYLCYMYKTKKEAQAGADELNKKFYLSDFDRQEIVDWFKAINFKPLFDKVEEITEIKLALEVIFDEYNPKDFEIKSKENLVDFIPMLRAAWEIMHVQTFSRGIVVTEEGELKLWGNLDYDYNHQDGGHNGATILSFNYTTKDGWKLTSEEERRIKNEEALRRGYYEEN